jgi:hypothetical protein
MYSLIKILALLIFLFLVDTNYILSEEFKIIQNNLFIENKGQWNAEVKFMTCIPGCNIWITNTEMVFDYFKYKEENETSIIFNDKIAYKDFKPIPQFPKNRIVESQVIRMKLLNSHEKSFKGIGKQETYYNYFKGKDSTKWFTYVPLYNEVLIENIYDKIDMRLYLENNQFRYDFIVHPDGNIADININFEGADYTNIGNNNIQLITKLGLIEHKDIVSYQEINKNKQQVETKLNFDNEILSFNIDNYNKKYDLTIDPLVFSTYIHGSRQESVESISQDANGFIYLTGTTQSNDFPITDNAYKWFYGSLSVHSYSFVTVLSPDGRKLKYSSYFGSDDNTVSITSYKIIINDKINIFGYITSYNFDFDDFPTTPNAFQTRLKGKIYNNTNIFITQFDLSGTKILNSTLFGSETKLGINSFIIHDSYIDTSGFIYILSEIIVSNSDSLDFPISQNAFQKKINGANDAFICKFNPDLSDLLLATFLGGSLRDFPIRMILDKENSIYIVGITDSKDFPTSDSAYQKTFNGNNYYTTFVTKLDNNFEKIIYSTMFGGKDSKGSISTHNICISSDNCVYISGFTNDNSFQTTPKAYKSNNNSHFIDAFVTKFNSNLSSLQYSTLLGSNDTEINGMKLDKQDNVIFIGNTFDTDFPTTTDAIQHENKGSNLDFSGLGDVVICKMSPDLSNLLYSTYLGGSGWEEGKVIEFDENGSVIFSGNTSSIDFPTTQNSFDPNGLDNPESIKSHIFVGKIDLITDVNENNHNDKISISPNPASDYIEINVGAGSKPALVNNIEIFNIFGERTTPSDLSPALSEREGVKRIDVSNLLPGIYFIMIGDRFEKFVKY